MNTTSQQFIQHALTLPDQDRAEIAVALIDSLDARHDPDAASAWDAEIAKRLGELDQGLVTSIPWQEARQRILGTKRGSTDS